ncbi:MAG: hypothetical protein HZT41_17700 [Dechloromonas sp.]|nr:MAG: hypothetical protein HZT41_17700 [Dechloromonas sp.]
MAAEDDLGGNFILRSPVVTTFQAQPTAPKPASIQEVTSRTLARQIREAPPVLALRADVKKPETISGF